MQAPSSDIVLNVPLPLWLSRIQSEYVESPGLRLTLPQASRFWGLDELVCRALFSALIDTGFLTETRSGAFVRAYPR